jgi:TRAP-type mannitol/chloroaromatic compound transport system substrate-binding protein
MNRSKFFKTIAGVTLALPIGIKAFEKKEDNLASIHINTGKKLEWKMVTTWPPNFPLIGESCHLFADLVHKMSSGRLKIRVFGGGELVPALEAFDTVRNGAAEIGSGAAYYWAGKIPAAQFFSSVPFGMNAQQMNSWMLQGEGYQLWKELYAPFNLVPFPGGNTGVQMGGWFKKEIKTISDLKGLKMRIPGIGGKVLEKVGGSPVLLAGGELYTGLERGIIDATEWLGPFHDRIMGFHEISPYYYYPGWQEPGTALEYFINKKRFEELPEDLQMIIDSAAHQINHLVLAQMETKNAEALEKLIDFGVQLKQFPNEVIQTLRVKTKEVIEEIIKNDPISQKVYASYRSFQLKSIQYAQTTEKLYYGDIQELI